MNQFGSLYSNYYDLLYSDKSYVDEVQYIEKLIKNNTNSAKTILDLGCGTGKHDELLCDKGYKVHGIDLSLDMLKKAFERAKNRDHELSFSHSNIQDLNLLEKFDVVVSLFHVVSYQNSNIELTKCFEVAKKHLKDGGVFIFDFWYGPGVLTDLPKVRVKRLENNDVKFTRIAEPFMNSMRNTVDVQYDVFIEDKHDGKIIEKKELHKMRYFFDTELEMVCDKLGFDIINKYEWMTENKPQFQSWNVVWIVKN